MTIFGWIQGAPVAAREELQSVPVMNCLREYRNNLFQMCGAYDGAMSEECKDRCRLGHAAVDELIRALEATKRPPEGIVSNVNSCARCGCDHPPLPFNKLDNDCGTFTHWAPCPNNGQPILLKIEDTGSSTE